MIYNETNPQTDEGVHCTMSETPPVSFSHLVMSLAQSAFVHLGEIPNPETQKPELNLPAAEHALLTLEMLKAKTAGNLDDEETQLLDTVLRDVQEHMKARA
ncbi:MAG: hypothetical protein ACI8S6_002975 [Myxococcota bacterium]